MTSGEQIAKRITAEELTANAKGLTSQPSPEILILARAVLDQQAEIERLEKEKQREFDIASGYHRQVVRRNEEIWKMEDEIERLQSELRIEKASQATRGNA